MGILRRYADALAGSCLLILNIWIAWRLFFVEYTEHFLSIEGAFVALARYISQHPFPPGWWPLWHGGMPFEIVYVPGLHAITGLTARFTGMAPAHAYHL